MTNAIAPITDLSDEKLGALIARSGYFQDAREAGQAVVKVLAGREIGLGPIASMTGIYVINGRVSFGANVMAAALKRTGRYTYKVAEHSEKVCRIEFFEVANGQRVSIGESAFTIEEAKRAGTKNLEKFPKNMLFARAMSNGVRWFAPDVFAGAPVYTPEELGANVNEDGDVIDAEAVKVERVQQAAETQAAKAPATLDEFYAEAVSIGYSTPDGAPDRQRVREVLKAAGFAAFNAADAPKMLDALRQAMQTNGGNAN